jgi:putative DNA primase/helicase
VSTFGASNLIVEAALTWYDAGCSVIPIRADGTKKPTGEWAPFMVRRMERERLDKWFTSHPEQGIGIICGKISGNLEMLELEGRACSGDVLDRVFEELEASGHAHVLDMFINSGYTEWTPSGGLHLIYRVSDHEVPGNTKVARRPATEEELAENPKDRIKVLAETRGEGGYVVVAPSGGTVHATGDSWSVAAGAIGVIPTITWQERQALVDALHEVLDEMPEEAPPAPRPTLATLSGSSVRPGDDYNLRAQWIDILGPHGWTISHHQGHTSYWVRPGKDRRDGHSATTGRAADGDRLYVFSSATEFATETPYTKFAAYTLLEHRGDYAGAARALRAAGYGAAPTTSGMAAPQPASALANMAWTEAPVGDVVSSPAQGTAVAVRDPNWLAAWAKPTVPADAFVYTRQDYAGASRVYATVFEDTFKFCGEQKKWYAYNGTVWREDKTLQHEDAVKFLLDEAYKQATREESPELTKWVRTMGRASSPNLARWAKSDPRIGITRDQLDKRRHMITLGNGVYDLDSDTFTCGHDPKLLLTKQLYVNYDKDATAPTWTRLLETLLPDPAVRRYLQRAAGHTLLGDAQERALFLLHGAPGTGKSQVVKVLERMFGDFAETANPTTFNDHSKKASITNDLNDLRGKRFVAVAELDEDERLNEALIKRLTGGDTAKSRGLYQENSSWDVEFSLWMVTNFLPRLNSGDAAIWTRVKPIKFEVLVRDQGPEVKKIGEKIFAEESSGVLNWLLEGVRMYLDEGLEDLPQITDAVAGYRHDSDTVAQFIDNAVEEHTVTKEPQAQMPSRNLHTMYQEWCGKNGIRWLGERRFAQRMESLGFERKRTNTGAVWLGIGTGNYGMLGTMAMRQ